MYLSYIHTNLLNTWVSLYLQKKTITPRLNALCTTNPYQQGPLQDPMWTRSHIHPASFHAMIFIQTWSSIWIKILKTCFWIFSIKRQYLIVYFLYHKPAVATSLGHSCGLAVYKKKSQKNIEITWTYFWLLLCWNERGKYKSLVYGCANKSLMCWFTVSLAKSTDILSRSVSSISHQVRYTFVIKINKNVCSLY